MSSGAHVRSARPRGGDQSCARDRAELAEDRFVLAVPAGHALARGATPVQARELKGESVLLLDDGHCFREQALAYCAKAGPQEPGCRATRLPTLVQMVSGGAGITLLPEIAGATERGRAELAIRSFAPRELARSLVLAWRKSSPLGPALSKITETLRASPPLAVARRSSPSTPTQGERA